VYFPTDSERVPDTKYFFAILNSISIETTNQLLQQIMEYQKEKVPADKLITLDPEFHALLSKTTSQISTQGDRISQYLYSGRKFGSRQRSEVKKIVPLLSNIQQVEVTPSTKHGSMMIIED